MKNFFLLFLLFLPFGMTAQSVKNTVIGSKLDTCTLLNQVNEFQAVACYDNGYTFLLMPLEKDLALGDIYRIERYDSNMRLLHRVTIKLKDKNGERKFCDVVYFQQKLYCLSSFKNNKNKKIYLFAQTMDKNTLTLNDDVRLVAEFENRSSKKNIKLNLGHCVSPDSSKMLILASPYVVKYGQLSKMPFGKDLENNKLFVCALDQNLNLLWQKDAASAINSGTFTPDKYKIDNLTNVYISGQFYENSSQADNMGFYSEKEGIFYRFYTYVQPNNYKNCILYYGNNGMDLRQVSVDLPNLFVKSLTFRLQGDKILCAGVYSESNQLSAKGVFDCKVTIQTGVTDDVHLFKFPIDSSNSRVEAKELSLFRAISNQSEWDPYQYALSDLDPLSDGSFLFIAEQQLLGRFEVNTSSSMSIVSTFRNGNLFVSTILPNGEISVRTEIKKKQYSYSPINLSYSYLLSDNNLFLLYNNSYRNYSSGSSIIRNSCLVEVDRNGFQNKQVINDFESFDTKSLTMQTNAVLSIHSERAFVYPLKAMVYKYRSYQKIQLNPDK